MTLFKKAESTSAYLKAGFLGKQGSGKTFTATLVAMGVAKMLAEKRLKEAGRPIYFIDSETGSDYITPMVREAGFEIYTAKTKAFVDLERSIPEAEANGCALIIDSITHFWSEFCEAYRKRRNKTRLDMFDWTTIKLEWAARFTTPYVNSNLHILMCGRQGYEYAHETDEDTGKKELIKTDIKMRAEADTGYEPSLLVLMEREMDMKTNKVTRVASVLKERFNVIDGHEFRNPTFSDFLPHIELLNLGGKQMGTDTTRDSSEVFADSDGEGRWRHEQKQKDIALEEMREEINRKCGYGQDQETKKAKAELVEAVAGTRAWAKVEAMKWQEVREVRNKLWNKTRGHDYGGTPLQAQPAVLVGEAPSPVNEPASTAGKETTRDAA